MHAAAGAVGERLGHEGADHAQLVGDFRSRHLEENNLVGAGQAIAVGIVDLELAVGVLVVGLIDVEATGNQVIHQLFQKLAATRQPLVVIAGFFQVVRVIKGVHVAVGVFLQQHEFRLNAGVERPAAFGQPGNRVFQHHTAVVFIGLAVDMAIAGQIGVTGHPGNQLQRGQIAHRHVIRAVRAHAQPPDGETGKTGARSEDVFDV